jgi:hypothetical protein
MGAACSGPEEEFDFHNQLLSDMVKQSDVSRAPSDSGSNESACYRHKDYLDSLVDHLEKAKMGRIPSYRKLSMSFEKPIETLQSLWKKVRLLQTMSYPAPPYRVIT